MNVMDLIAKISLDSQDYEKNVDSAKTSFSGLGSAIASGAKTIGKVAVGAFTAMSGAIAGATGALISNAKETAEYADNIDKMSQKMGFTTEAFQEWDFIMQHNGSSIESVKSSLLKMNKALESDTDAWEKLGLSQEELLQLSPEEQFEATITALQGVTDETEKAQLAEEIFSKGYTELMPLLNSTAEDTEALKQQVHDLGGVMSEEAVKAGAQFQDSLQNLQTAFTGAKNSLMGEFLPSLSTVMDGLSALISGDESGIGQITQGISDFASKVNERLPSVISTIGSVANALIAELPSMFEAIASQLPSILEQAIPVLINAVVGLADSVVKALPSLMNAIQSNIGVITSGLSKIVKSLGQIILKLTPTLLPMLLQVGIDLVVELARGFSENASEVINTIVTLINIVVEQLTNPDTLMLLLQCGLQILTAIINGIAENMGLLLETAGTLISNILTFLVESIPTLITSIGQNGAKIITDVLPQILTKIGEAGAELILNISSVIAGWIPDLISGAKDAFESLGQGMLNAWDWIKSKVMEIGTKVLTTIQAALSTIFEVGKNLVQGLWNGINNAKDWVLEKIKGFGQGILDGIKDFFGISSPSKKTAVFGRFLAEGLAVGVEEEAPDAFNDIQNALDDGMEGLSLDPLDLTTNASVKVSAKQAKSRSESKMEELLALMNEIINNSYGNTYPIYVGTKQVDEVFIDSKRRITTRSGGQVNV